LVAKDNDFILICPHLKRLSNFIDQLHIGSVEKQLLVEAQPINRVTYGTLALKVSERKPKSHAENMLGWAHQQDCHPDDKFNQLDRSAPVHLPLCE
jgi:hypothetical protein